MGMMSSPCARSQASANWAGEQPFSAAIHGSHGFLDRPVRVDPVLVVEVDVVDP
jgi:hypothetical protein